MAAGNAQHSSEEASGRPGQPSVRPYGGERESSYARRSNGSTRSSSRPSASGRSLSSSSGSVTRGSSYSSRATSAQSQRASNRGSSQSQAASRRQSQREFSSGGERYPRSDSSYRSSDARRTQGNRSASRDSTRNRQAQGGVSRTNRNGSVRTSNRVSRGGSYATNARTRTGTTRAGGNLLLPLLIGIAGLLLIIGVSSFACSTCSANNERGETASSGATSAASVSYGSNEVAAPVSHASASAEDLAWRDSDFAVDPGRTDWNYESNGRKVVYLTIDDGPSDKTRQVLDVLDQYGCRATFFVVGHNPDYYPLIKEAYERGHTIGLHTYSHDYETVYSSVDAYYADLNEIARVVEEQIGYVPCFIRFPGGSSNTISARYTQGIMSTLVDSVQSNGYQYYDWNMSTGDGSEHTADEIVGYATEPTGMDNIVLLCHDSTTKQSTVDALPRIIEYYQSQGYTFEAITRDTMVPHHGTSN